MSHDTPYNPDWVIARYDAFGEQEWERWERSPADAVSLFIHTHYLKRFVTPGSRVLEVGAGPGRFTQVLAEIGCRVVVADISPVQLQLHARYAQKLGFEHAVEERLQLDICDMSRLDSDRFDAVVCYGGPLSYVFDRAAAALGECTRVCKPGGHVLASVMSLWGSAHRFLPGVLTVPPESNRRVTDTGDLTPANWTGATHHCHMFRSAELRTLVTDAGLALVAVSAANHLSIAWDDLLTEAKQEPEKWQEVLRMELEACAEPGGLDAGTHIIAIGRKD
jgi:SAM-dependent methyltransferase